ncbi:MAG: ABC transporter substrate-binding protein [Candidatus Anammoxibacter sp.]
MKKFFFIISLLYILSASVANLFAYDIAVIKDSDIKPYNRAMDGFTSTLNENITEYVIGTKARGNKKIIKKIQSESPDLILAIGLNSMLLLEKKIDNIPIVYCMIMDPEVYGFVKKNNVTGITLRIPIKDQALELLRVVPYVKRLGVIYNPANTGHVVKEAEEILKELGIDLIGAKVKTGKAVPKTLRKLIKEVDALWLLPDATVITNASLKFIMLRSFANNVPVMAHSERFVEVGALMSLSPDYYDIGKQAAGLANGILGRWKSQLSPIIEPEIKNLIINLKTARKIGVNIPREIIDSAEKVFE